MVPIPSSNDLHETRNRRISAESEPNSTKKTRRQLAARDARPFLNEWLSKVDRPALGSRRPRSFIRRILERLHSDEGMALHDDLVRDHAMRPSPSREEGESTGLFNRVVAQLNAIEGLAVVDAITPSPRHRQPPCIRFNGAVETVALLDHILASQAWFDRRRWRESWRIEGRFDFPRGQLLYILSAPRLHRSRGLFGNRLRPGRLENDFKLLSHVLSVIAEEMSSNSTFRKP